MVETLDKTGSVVALGSGVAVSPNEVVTNVHVVEGGVSWTVKHGDKSWRATVINADSEHDPPAMYRKRASSQMASYFGRSFSARQPRTSAANIEPSGASAIWWGSK
jgi:S1-C subfamily serine protease